MAFRLYTIILTICGIFPLVSSQCPSKAALPNCDCSQLSDSPEKFRLICSGIKPESLPLGLKQLGALDLTIQNGQFSSLSGQMWNDLDIGKLTLINNGIERVLPGDLKGSLFSLRELVLSEPMLKELNGDALNNVKAIYKVVVANSTALERFPRLRSLPNLAFVTFTNNSIRFLEAGSFVDLPSLEEIDLSSNRIEIFDMSTFGDLPKVRKLDLTNNALTDISFLPLLLRHLPSLNTLFLKQNKISVVPNAFVDELSSVLTVDLSRNLISKLPQSISSNASSTLRELYLGLNYIMEIPPHFFDQATGLRTLSLANNSLKVLNTQLNPLKDLLYLRLEGNKLQRIDGQALNTLSRLQTLSLEGNQLTTLENNVFSGMDSLQTLDLSRNYLQEFRGTEIKNLTNLQNLLFGGNKLRNLYAGFESLIGLKRLDLSNNQISNIDDNTFANLKSLETLQLEGNLFMKIPLNALTKLPALERLTLSNNRLQALPALKAIGHLKYLALDHNNLPELTAGTFANLPDLRHLFLSDNHIANIQGGAFTNLYTLYVLDLSFNNLETIPTKVFDNLISLETLDLSGNNIIKLTDGSLGNLPLLRSVDLSQNKIGEISDRAFDNAPNLMQLNVSRNSLNVVPSAISRQVKLRRLDLSTNRVRRVESKNFASLQKLEFLYLQRNPICFLGEKTFTEVPQLKHIDLSQTDLRRIQQSAFRQGQDFSNVILQSVSIDCDCNAKWLRMILPNVRCATPGNLMQMKVSQIDPALMTCQQDSSTPADQCSILPVPTRPPRVPVGPLAPTPPSVQQLQTADSVENQIGRGSMKEAWLTQRETDYKTQELEAIQQAKQVSSSVKFAVSSYTVQCLSISVALVALVESRYCSTAQTFFSFTPSRMRSMIYT